MRFRAELQDISSWCHVTSIMASMNKEILLWLGPENTYVIGKCGEIGMVGPEAWATLKTQELFRNVILASASGDQIYMECSSEMLSRIARGLVSESSVSTGLGLGFGNRREVLVRLQKRQLSGDTSPKPTLTFQNQFFTKANVNHNVRKGLNEDIKDSSATQHPSMQMATNFDVPVYVMSPQVARRRTEEPLCAEPEVGIQLPATMGVRTAIERLGTISGLITISANKEGTLEFSVTSEKAVVRTVYRQLTVIELESDSSTEEEDDNDEEQHNRGQFHHHHQQQQQQREDRSKMYSVTVSNEHLLSALPSFPAEQCMIHISTGSALLVHIGLERTGMIRMVIPVRVAEWA